MSEPIFTNAGLPPLNLTVHHIKTPWLDELRLNIARLRERAIELDGEELVDARQRMHDELFLYGRVSPETHDALVAAIRNRYRAELA